jgi:three-Cys-motif partner protein
MVDDGDLDYVPDPIDGMPARVVREWTRRKHHYLERYADIFSVGMKNKFSRRAYLDLFAGPGRCFEQSSKQFYDGSPLIGLHRNFTDHVYVELDPEAAAALDARCAPWTRSRYVSVIPGDCNGVVDDVVANLPPYGLTFAFIDPTSWQITFDTVRKITNARRVDLLVSFFGGSMLRVGGLNQPRLDAFFGTNAWQTDARFLGIDGRPTLSGLLACYREQLATIGYLDQLSAREISVKNSKNVTMYLMAFFSKHALGYTFWDKIHGR